MNFLSNKFNLSSNLFVTFSKTKSLICLFSLSAVEFTKISFAVLKSDIADENTLASKNLFIVESISSTVLFNSDLILSNF